VKSGVQAYKGKNEGSAKRTINIISEFKKKKFVTTRRIASQQLKYRKKFVNCINNSHTKVIKTQQ